MELTTPFLKIGGTGIAYKTDAAEELRLAARALALLHCSARVENIEADYGKRTLVLATKQAACPPAYPRRAGLPERTPL